MKKQFVKSTQANSEGLKITLPHTSVMELFKFVGILFLLIISATLHADETKDSKIDTQQCPSTFNNIEIPKDGKLCQVFAADFPASMVFFVPKTPEEVLEYYQQNSELFSSSKQIKNRLLLQSSDKNTTLIISKDGQGSQVDILIKGQV